MVQIRLSRDLEENARAGRTPMTVDELLARFPEVPRDLRDEPILAEYVKAFGTLLRVAQKPSPCVGSRGDAQHVFYTRLVNDLAIYAIGSTSTASSPPRSRAPSCLAALLARRESVAAETIGARAVRPAAG